MRTRARFLASALALAFLVVHAQYLPRSLGDIDTINFALGVESFDVLKHQPHPPGYPVFIALGKVSTAGLSAITSWDRNRRAAGGLAIWGVVGGALLVWILAGFADVLAMRPATGLFWALLTVVSPLFWFTAARPLSDAAGLVAAVAVQWGLVRSWSTSATPGRWRLAAPVVLAFSAGLLIGMRSQTMWLTGPLLTWTAWRYARRRDFGAAAIVVGASATGALTWAVPLVVLSGGVEAYLHALAVQGAQDFRDVRMLATSPDAALLGRALEATFIAPWREKWLGQLMLALALTGGVHLLRRRRGASLVLAMAFAPYLLFHLLFQEPGNVRYALPVVVPTALLAAVALTMSSSRLLTTFGLLVAAASVVVAQQSLQPYGESVPPTFQAVRDAEIAERSLPDRPFVVAHGGLRRVADWFRREWPALPALRAGEHEWLRIVDHFRGGAGGRVWFMTDIRRTDAWLFDHRSRRVMREYTRDKDVHELIGQDRAEQVRWWEIAAPAWMLGEGWALTPEVGGVTYAARREPHQQPAQGFLRRDVGPHHLMVGGRYLSGPGDGVLVAAVDGRDVARWPVFETQPSFLFWLELAEGALDGAAPYATMTMRMEGATPSAHAPRVRLEQFDFAGDGDTMVAFDAGWYEPELDTATGQMWRWATDRSTLLVRGGGAAVRLTIEGESSLRYFDRPSTLVVSVGGREVARMTADDDFTEVVDLPAALLADGPTAVTIELDQSFVPADTDGSADRRRLGLRFYRVEARAH